MADSLDSSLQRSLVLGLQVLERASKRRVDWAQVRALDRNLGPALSENTEETPTQRQQSSAEELRAAFSSISAFMTQTSKHCQRYHGSLSALSDPEERHVCRFHCSSSGRHSALALDTQSSEDFHVEVFPGTYSITASDPHSPQQHASQQQTQQVSLADGESVVLTFHL